MKSKIFTQTVFLDQKVSIKDQFYYNSTSDGAEYGHTPTHILKVNRLLANKAPWEKTLDASKKKKTLIVNAFDLSGMTETQTVIIKERLEALAQQEFILQVFFKGNLLLWNYVNTLRNSEPHVT